VRRAIEVYTLATAGHRGFLNFGLAVMLLLGKRRRQTKIDDCNNCERGDHKTYDVLVERFHISFSSAFDYGFSGNSKNLLTLRIGHFFPASTEVKSGRTVLASRLNTSSSFVVKKSSMIAGKDQRESIAYSRH